MRILWSIPLPLVLAAQLQAQQALPQWSLTEELRIGGVDGPQSLTRLDELLVSLDGSTIYVGQREEHRIRVFDAFSGSPGTAAAEQAVRDHVRLPPAHPPVTGVVLANDGSVWLRREQRGRDSASWLILNPKGRLIATVRAPPSAGLLAVHGNVAWAAVKDELDVPYLVRYRVERPRR